MPIKIFNISLLWSREETNLLANLQPINTHKEQQLCKLIGAIEPMLLYPNSNPKFNVISTFSC